MGTIEWKASSLILERDWNIKPHHLNAKATSFLRMHMTPPTCLVRLERIQVDNIRQGEFAGVMCIGRTSLVEIFKHIFFEILIITAPGSISG